MKIDTTKIAGYEGMTAEEKIQVLESYEIADPDYSNYVKKDIYDKATSELASYKRQLAEKMTAEEFAEEEAKRKFDEMEQELAKLRKEKAVSNAKAEFLSLGFTEELASASAKAQVEGDFATVMANHKTHIESVKQSAIRDNVEKMLEPGGSGGSTDGITKEAFKKMTLTEKNDLYLKSPEVFKQLAERK